MKFSRILSILLLIVVAIAAAACSNSGASPTAAPADNSGNNSAASGTPADAVKGFFTAVYTSADPSAYVCSTAGIADAYKQAAEASAAAMPAGVTVNVDGLTFTTSDETADKATVTVAGQIVYTVSGNDTPIPFPSTAMSAVNEGGSWKFCGGAA